MDDCMNYPKEPMEFIKEYSFVDSDEVYTNGAELVPLFRVEQMLEHYLKPISDKQEQGLLIELPCKVGDTVYRIWTCGKSGKSIAEFSIEHIDIDNYPQIEFSYRCTKGSHSFYPYRFCKLEDFGKTVFLTRSEAEEALAKMGE